MTEFEWGFFMSRPDDAGTQAPSVLRAIVMSGALLAGGCSRQPESPPLAPPKVTVQRPELRELVDYDRYTGWLRASATVEVRARVRGHIKDVPFTDGDLVEKGDLLFELDPRPFQAEIDRARDQLNVDAAQYEFAKAEATRDEELFSKKAIAKSEYEKSIASRGTWEAKVEAAKQEMKRRELDLEYSRITAEISGRVGRALLTRGNLVNAGGSDPLLTTIVATDPIHVYFNVDEPALLRYRKARAETEKNAPKKADAPNGRPGVASEQASDASASDASPKNGAEAAVADSGPAAESGSGKSKSRENPVRSAQIPFEFGLEIEKGYPHRGTLDFADNQIRPGTGTIEVRGTAENADAQLVPGSRVRVQVPVSQPYKALVVPDVAVLSDQDQRYLLVVNPENLVLRKTVRLGKLLPDGMRVILPTTQETHQLLASDRVIVLGLQRARVNDAVDPVDGDGKPFPAGQR